MTIKVTAQLYDVRTTADRLSISEWQVFALIKDDLIKSVKIGKRRLISESAIQEYIAGLEAA